MTPKEIRKELHEIRYYYSRVKVFQEASKELGLNQIAEKVQKYNDVIRFAPARLYEIYYSLYLDNNTFESLAEKLGYTPDYIQKINNKLVTFFKENIKEVN